MATFSGLIEFVRVAESRSFTQAGESLNRSPSAVSKAVTALESRLGARLLQRTTRNLSLTAEGELFYDYAQRALAELDAAESAVAQATAEPRGRLRVDVPVAFGRLHVVPALADYMRSYPGVSVDIRLNDHVIDPVREGVDVVVRIGTLEDSTLISRTLATTRLVICGAPDYFARHGVPRTIDDLADHNCIAGRAQAWRLKRDGKPTTVAVDGTVQSNSAEGLRAAALAGLGIVQLRSFALSRDVQAGRLQHIMPDHIVDDLQISVAYAHRRLLSPRIRSFVDFLADRYARPTYWDMPFGGAA